MLTFKLFNILYNNNLHKEDMKMATKPKHQVLVMIDSELFEKFESYRWSNKLNKSEAVRKAIKKLVSE